MLRFRCPLCGETLELPETLTGKAGLCPHCHGRVRVPAPAPQPRPITEPPARNRRRQEEAVREVSVDDRISVDSHRDHDEDRPRRRHNRPRRSRRQPSDPAAKSARTGLVVGGIVGGVVLLGGCVAAVIFPPAALAVVGVGVVLNFAGGIWFLFVAFNDDVVQGFLCLFIPFYALYYLISNFEETKVPFFVQVAGMVIAMLGGCAGGVGIGVSGGEAFGP